MTRPHFWFRYPALLLVLLSAPSLGARLPGLKGIEELIPSSGKLPGHNSFLAVARRQLLGTAQGARLYAYICAGAGVQVRQDTVVSARGGEKRVIGVVSRPAVEDAIVAGDQVLLKDFVITFDERRFLEASKDSRIDLPGALYAHELGHLRALMEIGRSAFTYDGRTLHLTGDPSTRRRNLIHVLAAACDEEKRVHDELAPGLPSAPCSHALDLKRLAN